MLEFTWRFRDGVRAAEARDGIVLRSADGAERPVPLAAEAARWAERLNEGLAEHAMAAAAVDVSTAARVFRLKQRLRDHGLLVADLWCAGCRMATLQPHGPAFEPEKAAGRPAGRAGRWKLSRFAVLHEENGRLVLECADAPCDLVVRSDDLLRWIERAAEGTAPRADSPQGAVMAFLAATGFARDADEQEPAGLRTWEPHDRWFHCRTRRPSPWRDHAGTYRFRRDEADEGATKVEAPPAVRPAHRGERTELAGYWPTPSVPLRQALETRRSRREMGSRPVTAEQVGALLHQVGRITSRLPGDLLTRPYPAAGAIHELELYVAVGECDGLQAGFYHYRSEAHELTRLREARSDEAAEAVIAECARAWGGGGRRPQCVVVIASRLPRLAYKYAAIAYRLSLLNAGAALQTLCLVAEDLGLNGAPAGSGRSELFAMATEVPEHEETSIAEFGFGSRPQAGRSGQPCRHGQSGSRS